MMQDSNGVKPRYDGKGSEFSNIHRLLPVKCGMFDIDRMSAEAKISLEIKHQDECFIEYRTDWENSSLKVKAIFEMKHKMTDYVKKSMSVGVGTATWAQIEMSKMLGCRYFFVVCTRGVSPFDFYEWINDRFVNVGILSYSDTDKSEKIKSFWRSINLLED